MIRLRNRLRVLTLERRGAFWKTNQAARDRIQRALAAQERAAKESCAEEAAKRAAKERARKRKLRKRELRKRELRKEAAAAAANGGPGWSC